jgi:hypothetical protein
MSLPPPRPREERVRDTLRRLEDDVDLWVSTADNGRVPHLVPLSFLWDGSEVLISNPAQSVTSRNLRASGRARLGLGHPRDVVIIDGDATELRIDELGKELGDAFALKTGFDPRLLEGRYTWFRIRPRRIQAWREENELAERDLMRDGAWLG